MEKCKVIEIRNNTIYTTILYRFFDLFENIDDEIYGKVIG